MTKFSLSSIPILYSPSSIQHCILLLSAPYALFLTPFNHDIINHYPATLNVYPVKLTQVIAKFTPLNLFVFCLTRAYFTGVEPRTLNLEYPYLLRISHLNNNLPFNPSSGTREVISFLQHVNTTWEGFMA